MYFTQNTPIKFTDIKHRHVYMKASYTCINMVIRKNAQDV